MILLFRLKDVSGKYELDDEDLCLFRHFPSQKAIYFDLTYENDKLTYEMSRRNKSCTVKFFVAEQLDYIEIFPIELGADQ